MTKKKKRKKLISFPTTFHLEKLNYFENRVKESALQHMPIEAYD